LTKHEVNLTSHVCSVTTDVEGRLLLEKIADKLCVFAKSMLNINLLRSFTRKCGDEFQVVAKLILEDL
jgi:hypothetical protein